MNRNDFNEPSVKKLLCSVCGQAGKKVEVFTVRSLVKQDFIDMLRESNYFFFFFANCTVVYYGDSQNVIVEKDRLKTPVGIKEKDGPRPVCYCFGHTIEDIHREIRETGKSTVEKDISVKIQAGLCHCEDANPEGRCCLGNVAITVKEGFRLYGATKEETTIPVGTTNDCCTFE